MRSRVLVGKTIQRVVQGRFESESGGTVQVLEALEFTDGTVLRFSVIEGEGEYGVAPTYPARAIEAGA